MRARRPARRERPRDGACVLGVPVSGDVHCGLCGRLVVFADVELFADAELTQPACQLSAGTLLPLEGGWGNFLAGVDVRGFESEGLVETCGVDTVYAAGDSVMFEGQFALHPPIADVAVRP